MMSRPQNQRQNFSIADLTPTQFTLGMREVDLKRSCWREKTDSYFVAQIVPVILGPHAIPYIIDRHHLVRALYEEGETDVAVAVVEDLSALSIEEFWGELEIRGCVHPFDDEGKRRSYGEMPKTISDLIDDPYRSLAGALKREGGYNKSNTPFSEFCWADFLRPRISRAMVEHDFDHALSLALELAHRDEAAALPGYLGSTSLGRSGNATDVVRAARLCA